MFGNEVVIKEELCVIDREQRCLQSRRILPGSDENWGETFFFPGDTCIQTSFKNIKQILYIPQVLNHSV